VKERILFVTGKLAEPALRQVLGEVAAKVEIEPEVAVMPITVAALLTTEWVGRRLTIPEGTDRVVLPGYCRGELSAISDTSHARIERGPKDLRDLPEYFGTRTGRPESYGQYDIEILAEINHAPNLSLPKILKQSEHFRASGADVIDLGCNPGERWSGIGEAVSALCHEGFRVSVDSFDEWEVEQALHAGATLVLSVNSSNAHRAKGWFETYGAEVVAIPDVPSEPETLDRTIELLLRDRVTFRIDPIVEPIAFGFAASLGRYLDFRRRYPDLEMMMGIGNLTELTDADSAGINVMLAGFCQELRIRSVLTTEVIHWARSSVREFDLARRLMFHAVRQKVLPKHLEPELILFRDPKVYEIGAAGLERLASDITDRNYRLFAERGEIHAINGSMYLHGTDPFALFEEMQRRDPKLDASHAFYLGYEMSKAVTALTLGKAYTQDQALRWGFLTVPEKTHRNSAEDKTETLP
jgi:dihydropteroate synthase-like protein